MLDYKFTEQKLTTVINTIRDLVAHPTTLVSWFIQNYICQVIVQAEAVQLKQMSVVVITFGQHERVVQRLRRFRILHHNLFDIMGECTTALIFLVQTIDASSKRTILADLRKVDSRLYEYFNALIKLRVSFTM